MAGAGYKIKKQSPDTGGEGGYQKSELSDQDIKIAQIEVSLASLNEKIIAERQLKYWIVGAVTGVLGFFLAVALFYLSGMKDWERSYTELQDRYYQKLIEVEKDIRVSLTPPPTKDINLQENK